MTAATTGLPVPSAQAIRARVRGMRSRHRPVTGRLVGDLYTSLLTSVIVGGVLVEALIKTTSAPHSIVASPSAVTLRWLLVCLAPLCCGLTLRALLAVGPLIAGPATQTILLSTPVDRGSLLAPRLYGTYAGTTLGAAVVGVISAILLHLALPATLAVGAWAILIAVVALSVAIFAQVSRSSGTVAHPLANTLIGAAVAVACAVVVINDGGQVPPLPTVPAFVTAGLCVLGLTLSIVRCRQVLARLPLASLAAGFHLAQAVATAVVMIDLSLLGGVLEDRRWRRIARARSRSFHFARYGALLVADARRVCRAGVSWLIWLGLLIVPYAAATVVPPVLVPPVATIAATIAVGRFTTGLRAVSRSAALRRALGLRDLPTQATQLVVPAILALFWTALAAPAAGISRILPVALVPIAAVAVAYRLATRPPTSYAGVLMTTPFGDFPPDLIRQLLRGPLLLAVFIALQLMI